MPWYDNCVECNFAQEGQVFMKLQKISTPPSDSKHYLLASDNKVLR